MSNNDTINYGTVAYLCETAYRLWQIDFVFPEMEKEIFVDELVWFYQYLCDTIPGDTSYLDALDIFIKEWKVKQAYKDWYNLVEKFLDEE